MDNEAEPSLYSTVKIYSANDTIKPIYTGVTDKEGIFKCKVVNPGRYNVKILSTGKLTMDKKATVKEGNPTTDIGTIILKDDEKLLGEVTVTAYRPLISMEVDRISYDVQADEESKSSMTDDILRKVPMVSVDEDGTIKVNGGTNFTIYKNGRPNKSFSNNAKDLFKQLPAAMIEKIEVITEPGAREDAEGSSVILNIVTMKTTVIKGAMGNLRLGYQTYENLPTPSLSLSANYDKFTMSIYGGYTHSEGKRGRRYSTSTTLYEETNNTMTSESTSLSPYNNGYFGLEASLEPDTLNLFTLDFGGFFGSSKSHSWGWQQMQDAADQLLYSYNFDSHSLKNHTNSLYGSANYQRSTKRKGESIILSYRLSTSKYGGENETEYSDMVNMPVPYSGLYTENNEVSSEHTVQLDWTRPFNKYGTLDVGGKYVYRINHSRTFQDYYNYRTDESDFKHATQIGAAYASYRLNLKKFGVVVGIRYEFSRLDAKFLDGNGNNYHSNLNDLVPNAGIVYNLNQKNSFRVNFGSSIRRPGITYLNPKVTETPNSTSYGNPDLESVRYNSLSFSYTLMLSKIMLSFSTNYSFSNNNIIQEQWVNGNHLFSTYANTGHVRNVSPYLYINWRISNKTSLTGSGGVTYNYIKNKSLNQEGGGWGYNLFVRLSQQLPWKLYLSAYVSSSRTAPGLYSAGYNRSWSSIYYTISLQRSFLKENRLTVSAAISDPWHYKYPGYTEYTNMSNYHSVTEHYRYYRTYASFSISYRFGSMKASVKKLRSVENNDVVGGMSTSTQD